MGSLGIREIFFFVLLTRRVHSLFAARTTNMPSIDPSNLIGTYDASDDTVAAKVAYAYSDASV